jgi:hypothetical protein
MADESDATAPRPRGEAAWKADRDAIEQRNSQAKRRARERVSARTQLVVTRERRLEAVESTQLQVLNERLRARAGRPPIR